VPAYYYHPDRRQQTYQKISDKIAGFKSKVEKSGIDIKNRDEVAKYIYDEVTKLTYDGQSYPNDYEPRAAFERNHTIVGFVDGVTRCEGYTMAYQSLSNMYGVPTILQTGKLLFRDGGNITGSGPHAWPITQMGNNEWYFGDPTLDRGENAPHNYFLKGQGDKSPSGFLYVHEINPDVIYPECAIKDYPVPVRSMQASVSQTAAAPRM